MPVSVIAHNIRSTHNVGSLFRTCEGFGVSELVLSGYTPYPEITNDTRLPHIRRRVSRDIHKTALGAEDMLPFRYVPDIHDVLRELKYQKVAVIGLEQDKRSVPLPEFHAPENMALLLGEEIDGIAHELREHCDVLVEIPMKGQKESFNVSVAAGIALYSIVTLWP